MLDNEKYFDVETMVDEVLLAEPGFSLPNNFADVIAEKVSRRFAWEQYLREFLIYLSVFVGFGIATAAVSYFGFEANWKEWLSFMLSNAGLVAGIYFLATFILFADRVLLRYFMYKSKMEVV